jgi:hypothetical protein
MPVSYSDLLIAHELVSSTGMGLNRAFVNRETGEIHTSVEGDESLSDLPDDIDESDKYVALPSKHELDLGRPLVFRFVDEFLPGDYHRVRSFFGGRGAYARFKDLLEHRGLLDQWHDFENKAEEKALREWCKENGIEIAD